MSMAVGDIGNVDESVSNSNLDLPVAMSVGGRRRRIAAGPGSARLVSNTSDGIDDPARLGNKLRAAREAKGLSQIELGEMTGYSNGWISSVERGTAVPTSTFARRMEIVLGCDLGLSELVGRSGKRRGSVGNWGMTASEVAGYVGLSRTRIYALMRAYVERDLDTPQIGILPWKDVDGYRRISISDCAKWIVEDMIEHADSNFEVEYARVGKEALIEAEENRIRDWLKTRRSSL
jgi:DNA-binding XRE family transcriptional regulator